MNKTKNYQLSQWESTDRIFMSDFNSDNAKIDTALAEIAAACPVVKLLDVTLTEDATQVDLDLSGMDLTGYAALRVYIQFRNTPTQDNYCYIRLNGQSGTYYHSTDQLDYLAVLHTNDQSALLTTADLELFGLNGGPTDGASIRYINSELRWSYKYSRVYGGNFFSSAYLCSPADEQIKTINFICGTSGSSYDKPTLLSGSRFVVYGMKL